MRPPAEALASAGGATNNFVERYFCLAFPSQQALGVSQHEAAWSQQLAATSQQALFSAQQARPCSQQPALASRSQQALPWLQQVKFAAQQSAGRCVAAFAPKIKPTDRTEKTNSLVNMKISPLSLAIMIVVAALTISAATRKETAINPIGELRERSTEPDAKQEMTTGFKRN